MNLWGLSKRDFLPATWSSCCPANSVNALFLLVVMAIFPGEPGLAGFTEAKEDGSSGDNWGHKTCKAPVKLSPTTNQHPVFLQAGCPSCPTNSVTLNGKISHSMDLLIKLRWGSFNSFFDQQYRQNQGANDNNTTSTITAINSNE